MGTHAPAIGCDLSAEQQRQFAQDSFMPRLLHTTPTWSEVLAMNAKEEVPPILDRIEVRLLEGECAGGTINGRATIHASFIHLAPHLVDGVYRVTEVEVRDVCDYRDLRRAGECRRYQVHRTRQGQIGADQQLTYIDALPPEPAVIFDYGAYVDGGEAAPGLRFETTELADGRPSNMALARAGASNGRIRYDEYTGGGPTDSTFYRRVADRKLHGPVVNGDMVTSCYENGTRVIRDTCEVQ